MGFQDLVRGESQKLNKSTFSYQIWKLLMWLIIHCADLTYLASAHPLFGDHILPSPISPRARCERGARSPLAPTVPFSGTKERQDAAGGKADSSFGPPKGQETEGLWVWLHTVKCLDHSMKGFQRNSTVSFGENIDPQSEQHAGPLRAERVSQTYVLQQNGGTRPKSLNVQEIDLQDAFSPAECERTKFSWSSLWKNICVEIRKGSESREQKQERLPLLELADRNDSPGKFTKPCCDSIDNCNNKRQDGWPLSFHFTVSNWFFKK